MRGWDGNRLGSVFLRHVMSYFSSSSFSSLRLFLFTFIQGREGVYPGGCCTYHIAWGIYLYKDFEL